jgi:hypothetical protein
VRAATRGQNAGPCRLDADHGARGEWPGGATSPTDRTNGRPSVRPRILSDGGSLRPVDGAPRAHPAPVEAVSAGTVGVLAPSGRLRPSRGAARARAHSVASAVVTRLRDDGRRIRILPPHDVTRSPSRTCSRPRGRDRSPTSRRLWRQVIAELVDRIPNWLSP